MKKNKLFYKEKEIKGKQIVKYNSFWVFFVIKIIIRGIKNMSLMTVFSSSSPS